MIKSLAFLCLVPMAALFAEATKSPPEPAGPWPHIPPPAVARSFYLRMDRLTFYELFLRHPVIREYLELNEEELHRLAGVRAKFETLKAQAKAGTPEFEGLLHDFEKSLSQGQLARLDALFFQAKGCFALIDDRKMRRQLAVAQEQTQLFTAILERHRTMTGDLRKLQGQCLQNQLSLADAQEQWELQLAEFTFEPPAAKKRGDRAMATNTFGKAKNERGKMIRAFIGFENDLFARADSEMKSNLTAKQRASLRRYTETAFDFGRLQPKTNRGK